MDVINTALLQGGSEFPEAMQETADIMLGKAPPSHAWPAPANLDVRAIRARIGLSQTRFARRFGFSPALVREWEQGRRRPEAAARVLLLVVDQRLRVGDRVSAADAMEAA